MRKNLFFFFLLSLLWGPGAWGRVVVHTPPDGALFHFSRIHVVVEAPSMPLRVEVEGKDGKVREGEFIRKEKLKKGVYFYHFLVVLNKGRNTIYLRPGSRRLQVVYKPRLPGVGVKPTRSLGFIFHRREEEAPCLSCHKLKITLESMYPSRPKESPCYSCHYDMLTPKDRWVHGPVANWSCLSCHYFGYNKNGVRFTLIDKGLESLCFRCHVSKKQWLKMKHVHGPVGVGDCTVCHDPHGGPYKFQLRAEGKEALCLMCHVPKRKELSQEGFRPHAILEARGCTICHSPHATNYFRQIYAPTVALCVACHPKFKGMKKGHPLENHPVMGPKDPRHPQQPFTCASCHDPHGSLYPYLLIGPPGTGLCTKCHKY